MTHTEVTAPARTRSNTTARDLALIATFAALIVVCAILPAVQIGGLVPITLQTFGVILAGAVLGAQRGFYAVLLYLAIGAIGLPVFSAGSAGLAPFVGPSAGYLVAMPFAAALTGFIVERLPRKKLTSSIVSVALAGIVSTVLIIHTLGVIGLAWRGEMGIPAAFIFNLSFVPGDLAKGVLAALVATAVHRAFPDLLPKRR